MTVQEMRRIAIRCFGEYGWQTRLAEALGVNARTVRHWAAGDRAMSQPVAMAIRSLEKRK